MKQERNVVLSAVSTDVVCDFVSSFLEPACHARLRTYCGGEAERLEAVRSYDFGDSVAFHNQSVMVRAARLPYGIRIAADLKGRVWYESDWEAMYACDMVLFLAPFPYEQKNQVRKPFYKIEQDLRFRLGNGIVRMPCYRMVFLIDPNRHFAASDYQDQDETVKKLPGKVQDAVKKESLSQQFLLPLMDYIRYDYGQSLAPVLYYNTRMPEIMSAAARQQFADWKEWREEGMDEEYMILLELSYGEIISQKGTYKVTKFEKMQKGGYIWKSWVDSYWKMYSEKIFGLADSVYQNAVSQICFWNEESDKKTLHQFLCQRYHEYFTRKGERINKVCPDNQSDYQDLLNRTKIDITFIKSVDQFITHDMKNDIRNYIDYKERLLSNFLHIG